MSDPNPYRWMPQGESLGGTPTDPVAEVGTPVDPPIDWGLDAAAADADAD